MSAPSAHTMDIYPIDSLTFDHVVDQVEPGMICLRLPLQPNRLSHNRLHDDCMTTAGRLHVAVKDDGRRSRVRVIVHNYHLSHYYGKN